MAKEAQQTVKKPARVSGVGLMLGVESTLTLLPAPPDSGVVFTRIDLPDRPEVPVSDESDIVGMGRCSGLQCGKARVQTIEHVLSALAGMGIDNAVVELDAPEPPIGDGSALPFVDAIQNAGIEEQDAERRALEIDSVLYVEEEDRSVVLLPSESFRATFTFDRYHRAGVENQIATFDITPDVYAREIAPARTFCFADEVDALKRAGLGKGASDENALVIDEDGLRNGEYRFENELVRHKILDLIGDLRLAGRLPRGHAIAARSQHSLNHRLAEQLREVEREARHRLTEPLGPVEIEAIIPHRSPFMLVDRVVAIEEGKRIVAQKAVSYNEEFFRGHFPGHPVMPGVLITEAMAQTAGVLLGRREQFKNKIAYFMTMDNVKFRDTVKPGDTLLMAVEVARLRRSVGLLRGVATVNGKTVAEADFSFALVDQPERP